MIEEKNRLVFDLLIVGGGINGAGIARDASGRGLSVLLVEQADLASHTSSASTKLIHGGLRYLEHFEFRLVREALMEREVLLNIAPHIIWPMQFLIPQTRSRRPDWMVRFGLFLYDHLGNRNKLPPTEAIDLARDDRGAGLKMRRGRAFVYSDCWVDDSRLVVLNARDAADRGAQIWTRSRFIGAARVGDCWHAQVDRRGETVEVIARGIVNAAGPWVGDALGRLAGVRPRRRARLVKGSHIVLRRLYSGNHAFLLQDDARRVVFAIPYEDNYTLVGTTDQIWQFPPGHAKIDRGEIDYLLGIISSYFDVSLLREDVVWSYSGIRPLYDDRSNNPSSVTRDYVLDLDRGTGKEAPSLSIFGGKITTYRRLAEHALAELAPSFPEMGSRWTASVPLPGGSERVSEDDVEIMVDRFPVELVARWSRQYGSRTAMMLGNATSVDEMGRHFGAQLYAREIDFLIEHEWAETADDVLFRRTKLGLRLDNAASRAVDAYVSARVSERCLFGRKAVP